MHHWYCVTAKEDSTITSPVGLNVSLSAGTQYFFYADTNVVEITGEASLTQTPSGFSFAPVAVSGGGGSLAPVPLVPDSRLRTGGIYMMVADGTALDLSALTIATVGATAEIWLDYTADTPVIWPEDWLWLAGSAPDLQTGFRYAFAIRNDGDNVLAGIAYAYRIIRL